MPDLIFPALEVKTLPIQGLEAHFPVHRIFCIGRNYAAHAAEMGTEVDRAAPFYFTKGLDAVAPSGSVLPYPPGTAEYHHEVELVVALGAAGFRVSPDKAEALVFGYGSGLDMTRRDLQAAAKDKRRPWDVAKDVEGSAVLSALTPAHAFAPAGQRIHLSVNGQARQDASLAEMIHSVPDIIADLSRYYHLRAGDLIMTGTPAGVGAVGPGDHLCGGIDGLAPVELTLGPAE